MCAKHSHFTISLADRQIGADCLLLQGAETRCWWECPACICRVGSYGIGAYTTLPFTATTTALLSSSTLLPLFIVESRFQDAPCTRCLGTDMVLPTHPSLANFAKRQPNLPRSDIIPP